MTKFVAKGMHFGRKTKEPLICIHHYGGRLPDCNCSLLGCRIHMQSSLTVYYLRYTSDYVGQTRMRHRSKPLLLWWSDGFKWQHSISEHPGHIGTTSFER